MSIKQFKENSFKNKYITSLLFSLSLSFACFSQTDSLAINNVVSVDSVSSSYEFNNQHLRLRKQNYQKSPVCDNDSLILLYVNRNQEYFQVKIPVDKQQEYRFLETGNISFKARKPEGLENTVYFIDLKSIKK
jgi:hypothetical protein